MKTRLFCSPRPPAIRRGCLPRPRRTLGVELLYATDRCDQLDDPWSDGAIAVRYHEEWRSVDTVLKAVDARPVNAVLAVGDRPTVMAAYLSRLLGLPGHPPEAAAAARDKRLLAREAEGRRTADAVVHHRAGRHRRDVAARSHFVPGRGQADGAVGKPRRDSRRRSVSFATAFDRVRRLLASGDVRELRDPEADVVQIEEYIDGAEYALEGLLENGLLRTLAIFDKPDPLDGPFFEETIYVTPSRLSPERAAAARSRRRHGGHRARAASRPDPRRVPRHRARRVRARSGGAADRRTVRQGVALRVDGGQRR